MCEDAAQTMEDAAQTMEDAAQTMEDAAQTMEDAAQTTEETAQTMEDAAQTIRSTVALRTVATRAGYCRRYTTLLYAVRRLLGPEPEAV
jgi:methyl-accepting chemotaxis protein